MSFFNLYPQSLKGEFSTHEALITSVDSTLRDLSQSRKGSVYMKSIRELDQLRTKWSSIHSKFSEVKENPMKKLEGEFIVLQGQVLSNLDKMSRGAKKLKLVSAEPRDIKNLLDRTLVGFFFSLF